ncbi:MAG: hypothetical protein LBI33_01915 [Propionibacteriaceae bacterium]|jgi:hypothetical protein|nr:hypothetical protein [Propionibacteriaceae bacterium]
MDDELIDTSDEYYERLDALYTSGAIRPDENSRIYRGEEAVAIGRQHLMWATNTTTIEDAVAVALGRPRLSAEPNETIRTRVPKPLLTEVRSLARTRQTTVSQIVREAMREYVQRFATAAGEPA